MITASYTVPGMTITDHQVEVPLDWFDENETTSITVFAREIGRASCRERVSVVV